MTQANSSKLCSLHAQVRGVRNGSLDLARGEGCTVHAGGHFPKLGIERISLNSLLLGITDITWIGFAPGSSKIQHQCVPRLQTMWYA
jgi:hypothetical protein